MSVDPIQIFISADATNVLQSMAQVAREAQETFERAYANSIEKAEQKLHQLTQKQQEHNAVIEQNKQKMQELEALRSRADAAEQQRLDAEIRKLQQLNQAREQDVLKVEEKKAAQEKLIQVAQAQTENEKLGIQLVTQQRMIDIGVMRDQQRAQATAAASAQAAAAQRVAQSAAVTAKLVADIDEVNRKQNEHRAVIDKDREAVEKLQKERGNAEASEQKRIDATIEKYKKLISDRETELMDLDKKRLKLEELLALEKAGSEAAKAQIKAETSERMAAIEATKDQAAAQSGLNETVDSGGGIISRYLGYFTGIGAVMKAVQMVTAAFQEQQRAIEGTNDALKHWVDLQNEVHGGQKDFNTAFGLTSQGQQTAALASLNQAATNAAAQGIGNFTPDEIGKGAVALGPAMRDQHINDPTSARFMDLATAGAVAQQRGFSTQAVRDLGNHFLQQNPSMSGADLRARFGGVLAAAEGSPETANNFAAAWAANADKFKQAGMSMDDVQRLFIAQRRQGTPTESAIDMISKSANALDRMLGQRPEDAVATFENMQDIDPRRREFLQERMKLAGSPLAQLKLIEQARSGGTPASIDKIFEKRVSGALDDQSFVRGMVGTLSSLPVDERNRIGRAIAGPRGVVGLDALYGLNNVSLPTNAAPLVGDTSNAQASNALSQIQRNNAALSNPQDPAVQEFEQMLTQADATWKTVDRDVLGWKQKFPWMPSDTEGKAGIAYAQRFLQLADLREQIASGKVKASPGQIAALDGQLSAFRTALGMPDKSVSAGGAIDALAFGSSTYNSSRYGKQTFTRAGELARLRSMGSTQYLEDTLSMIGLHSNTHALADADVAAKHFAEARKVEDSIRGSAHAAPAATTQPTTQPTSLGPQSSTFITNHIRQVNYGMGFSAVGAPESWSNVFG